MGMIVVETPGAAAVADPAEPSAEFRYWQWRILLSSMIGYAFFYVVRTNFSFAIPGITAEFGYSKEDLGWCITAHGLLYGVSRFAAICHGPLRFRHRQAGVGTLPSRGGHGGRALPRPSAPPP